MGNSNLKEKESTCLAKQIKKITFPIPWIKGTQITIRALFLRLIGGGHMNLACYFSPAGWHHLIDREEL